jgi:hypothetical protein
MIAVVTLLSILYTNTPGVIEKPRPRDLSKIPVEMYSRRILGNDSFI